MDDPSTPIVTAGTVRDALSSLMPPLASYWSRPLAEHGAAVYADLGFHSKSPARKFAMTRLQDAIVRAARRAGYDRQDAASAAAELRASPVIQTGPHCLMLFEPDAFYTHLFSLMGLQASQRHWHIAYSGSTMSFKESAKKGPGWLRLDGQALNLFGLSRNRMDGSSICCRNGPFRFILSNPAGERTPGPSARRLYQELPEISFPTAAAAIEVANQHLWLSRFSSYAKLLQLDDFDIADLVADHLEHSSSWLSQQFFLNGGATYLLRSLDALNAGSWQGWIRRTTDYFWLVGQNRIVPLVLKDGYLRAAGAPDATIEFTPAKVASLLRQRRLLPSLFTVFLVLAILPGVRALGGCRQTVYLPLMRYLAANAISRSGDRDLLHDLYNDRQPSLWGHRVLRISSPDPYLEIDRGVPALLAQYGAMTLGEASGDLISFTSDPVWAEMSRHLLSGVHSTASAEWAWSGFAANH